VSAAIQNLQRLACLENLSETNETAMTRPFSIALKHQMVARLTGVNAMSAAQLARETGIKQQNLSRWLSEARNSPFGTTDDGIVFSWTAEQKARIIAQAAGLECDELTAYLQAEGVGLADFRRWRLALEEAGQESVGMARRIRKLERELARKERALAEAATLLMLREAIGSRVHMDTPTPPSSIADYMRHLVDEPRSAELG
jgi:transposase